MIVKHVSELSGAQLEDAVAELSLASGAIMSEIKQYYKLLPDDVLRNKAEQFNNGEGWIQSIVKVSPLEERIITIKAAKQKCPERHDVKHIHYERTIPKDTEDEQIVNELYWKSYVRKAVVLAPGVIGVETYNSDKVRKFCSKHRYSGEVIFREV